MHVEDEGVADEGGHHQTEDEHQISVQQGHVIGALRYHGGHHEEQHGSAEEDGHGQSDSLAAGDGQVERALRQQGGYHQRDDEIDRVEQGLPATSININ